MTGRIGFMAKEAKRANLPGTKEYNEVLGLGAVGRWEKRYSR